MDSGKKCNKRKTIFRLERWKVYALYLVVYDALVVSLSYFGMIWLRYDCQFSSIPAKYLNTWVSFAPFYALFCVGVFAILKLYNSIWRFASYHELYRITIASIITCIFHIVGTLAFYERMPISYYVGGFLLQAVLVLGIRFSYRFVRLMASANNVDNRKRVMIVGAGASGQMLVRDIRVAHEVNDKVCCFIDDDPEKWNRYIDGIPVVGGRDDILANVEKFRIKKIFVALPSATPQQRRDILDICKETRCELKNLPGMYQFINGDVSVNALKDVVVEDLLGRDPIVVNDNEIFTHITGKVVLVTGGGGSIGGELCRQIAAHAPKKLIVFDIYENSAHEIGLELKDKFPQLDLEVIIGSVRDSAKLKDLFSTYRPQIVYHAAAHKHVPLMESSPRESIKNNSIGTYKTAYASMCYGVERFVLISTDKAVNPTNIMGASKRICEMVIQSFDKKIRAGNAKDLPSFSKHGIGLGRTDVPQNPKTEFVAVRFGNVLGSNGSVIPRFKQQIAAGGPVTVTHPDIIRYFMTIPEAVSLVLQAGAYARGGEIFVLDMGEPVKIDTLARNLIKLSGLRPDIDIKISYIGLRPGEKLYEEKLMAEEGMKTTANKLIHIGKPLEFDVDIFLEQLQELNVAAITETGNIKELVAKIVDTYKFE